MSLDITLFTEAKEPFCSHCGNYHQPRTILFETNITHNLGKMAKAADIYSVLWRPETVDVDKAEQLIAPLEEGIGKMTYDPEYYQQYDASNGWGTYEQFLPWLEELLEACKKYPNAKIEVSR